MRLDHSRAPLFEKTLEYASSDMVSMMMPAHGMGKGISSAWKEYAGENIFRMDMSDLPGQDDLYEPEGVIKEAQELAADAWGAQRTFFCVNGTSGANAAAVCTAVREGEKIIVPRNCHKSVIYGLIMSGAVPVYAFPDVFDEYGIIGGMDPEEIERVCRENSDAKAVISVAPSYHGIYSDLEKISETVHRYGMIHIVDEAHGGHVYFNDRYPQGALGCGADIVTQSTHKVCGSLQQSSMLHVNSGRIDTDRLSFNMQMVQNTSASGLLAVSLDLARQYMALHGREELDTMLDLVSYGRDAICSIDGFSVLDRSLAGRCHISDVEPGRLVISAAGIGITGYVLRDLLAERDIHIEFSDNHHVGAFPGLGATREDMERLIAACRSIGDKYRGRAPLAGWRNRLPFDADVRMTPRQAYTARTEEIDWKDAEGRICAGMIVPYPPGIPAVCPGEMITGKIWDFLSSQDEQGIHLHGVHGDKLDTIKVVAE